MPRLPVLIVDGPAEEGKYLAKSQNGKGGEAEEAGYTREAGPSLSIYPSSTLRRLSAKPFE
jgi:hypothetical protein